ncbi:MAG: hypothetical protein GWN01_13490 [Nitrosopumilaceae archaeon]|nr:hypothetical protein [Nitrosopumilaceae archaeon]NIU01877.1 hypothetical protein [Nitrosopumilaceae archaeon]NIU88281.1 hypothetical protein [Nitrosopumilaceae archaeon]NIV66573.1 hypothetical protein [Nitrosopumilaceae archaeon]NIX62478.1 hypothetical protein [Nitrosopumilaceae archaeon]
MDEIRGSLRERVMHLMQEKGPQSVNDLCKNLGISNGSSRSVLVKLHKAGKIERISKGTYKLIQG